ncbi:MAG: SHOCT domain-containing protein [Sedimentisphaerales bacterium]|nr:SHOCT domain-containing protein [Sedimentisphaerales bacterium]
MWFVHDGMGWWMIFGGIWMLLFLGGIIALIIWGIKKITERSNSGEITAGKSSPLDVAKERYARGEISKDEFEQMKKDLS